QLRLILAALALARRADLDDCAPAALSLASAISDRWTGRQLNSVSINSSQSLADNLRHWTAALSLLRSEAVANSALKDDAASTRGAVRPCWLGTAFGITRLPWGPPDARWLAAFAIDSAMEKAEAGGSGAGVVVSSVATALAAKAEPPHSPASTVAQRTRCCRPWLASWALLSTNSTGFLSASGGASSSALQSVESFRLVASRFGLLSR
uniref:E3 ubiquitin-protein ligase listerin n=1 Tax=Macrostomum lignano TaxID=282301 RepID=A0A1I8FQM7_9PLAT